MSHVFSGLEDLQNQEEKCGGILSSRKHSG